MTQLHVRNHIFRSVITYKRPLILIFNILNSGECISVSEDKVLIFIYK